MLQSAVAALWPGVFADAGQLPAAVARAPGGAARRAHGSSGVAVGTLASALPEARERSAAVADSDDVLLGRISGGDAGAYREFSERHLAAILRYAFRLLGDVSEAEDVTQETFLRVWQRAADYQPRGGKPTTWLYRIAHNLCIDRLRRRRKQDPAALDRLSSGDRPADQLDRAHVAAEVSAALESLPERQRAALVLCHYEGLSNLEAAEVLGCRVHALESLLARARRALRESLGHLYAQVQEDTP